jgi:hypothetical protein
MMHRKLIRHLLEHPEVSSLSVFDGEDVPAVDAGRSWSILVEAVEAVEQSTIIVHRFPRTWHGRDPWALVIPHAVDPDETVVDFSAGGIIDAWFDGGAN